MIRMNSFKTSKIAFDNRRDYKIRKGRPRLRWVDYAQKNLNKLEKKNTGDRMIWKSILREVRSVETMIMMMMVIVKRPDSNVSKLESTPLIMRVTVFKENSYRPTVMFSYIPIVVFFSPQSHLDYHS